MNRRGTGRSGNSAFKRPTSWRWPHRSPSGRTWCARPRKCPTCSSGRFAWPSQADPARCSSTSRWTSSGPISKRSPAQGQAGRPALPRLGVHRSDARAGGRGRTPADPGWRRRAIGAGGRPLPDVGGSARHSRRPLPDGNRPAPLQPPAPRGDDRQLRQPMGEPGDRTFRSPGRARQPTRCRQTGSEAEGFSQGARSITSTAKPAR